METGMSSIDTSKNVPATMDKKYGGAPIVFLQEKLLFGDRKPSPAEWLKHTELYEALSKVIDCSHLTGLQRVNGFWRIYLDNVEDKVLLMSKGVTIRGKNICVLNTNPNRLDGEVSTSIKVKNVPLSVEDGVIERVLTLKGLDIISHSRIKLRIKGRLTNCETGDRIFIAKASTLKEPLPKFMSFGNFTGRVIHDGQENQAKTLTCKKCLEQGHVARDCENDWKCMDCKQFGHKRGQCQVVNSEIPRSVPLPTITQAATTSIATQVVNSEDPRSVPQLTITQAATTNTDTQVANNEVPRSVPQLTISQAVTTSTDKQENDQPKDTPTQATDKQKKKKEKKITNGQMCIDSFCTKDIRHSTPNKNKTPVALERSPPTPAELLNERSKKNRQDLKSSDDSNDSSESDN